MDPRATLKEQAACLALPMLLAFFVIGSHLRVVALTADGVTYLQIARNILHGDGLGWQALWAPPLHSILIAAVSFLGQIDDLLVAATVTSVLAGFFLVAAVYFTACQVFNRRVAAIAAGLAALSPHLQNITFSDEAEISYTFFLTLSLGLLSVTLKRDQWIYAAATGVSFALAYLARSEGFLVMALVLGALVLLQGNNLFRSRVFAKGVVALLFFTLVASPYLFFLKKNYGAWVISPKASYVMIWMKSMVYHDNDKGENGNDELWGLSENGKLCWQEPKGVADLYRFLASHPQKSVSVYLENLSAETPGSIPNGSGMEDYPQLFPVYLAVAALFSVFLTWGPQGREKKGILCAGLAVFLILPVFTGGWWKYLVPYLPVLIILATKGLTGALELATAGFRGNARLARTILTAVAAAGVAWHFSWGLHPGKAKTPAHPPPSLKNDLRAETAKAGAYGLQLLGPGHNCMISWSPLVYYLKGKWTARPVTSPEAQLAYAIRNKVDYLVMDIASEEVAPNDMAPPPGYQMVGLYLSQNTPLKVGFYRLRYPLATVRR